MVPFALAENCLRNFLQRQVGESLDVGHEGLAANQQSTLVADFLADQAQLIVTQAAGGDVDKIAFAAVAVHPEMRLAGRVGETHVLAHGLGEHFRVVGLVDDPVAPLILFQQRRRQTQVAEPATALPIHGLADATLIRAVDNLLQARHDMGMAVLAQLDHDPAPTHLVRHGAGGAGAGEGIEDEVARIGGDMDYSFN